VGKVGVKLRLGKIEKKALEILRVFKSMDMEREWTPNKGHLSELADQDSIDAFERGDIVPLWMLRREIQCGKTVLARALKTLEDKGFIRRLDAMMDTPFNTWFVGFHTKYVRLIDLPKYSSLRS
jgi:DNA-binding MarR family transcriptional regulator